MNVDWDTPDDTLKMLLAKVLQNIGRGWSIDIEHNACEIRQVFTLRLNDCLVTSVWVDESVLCDGLMSYSDLLRELVTYFSEHVINRLTNSGKHYNPGGKFHDVPIEQAQRLIEG